MNSQHISNFEYVANEYAKEIISNEEKRKYFLDGVKWAISALESTIANAGHPMANPADNEFLHQLTLRDIKKAIKQMKEIK